MGTPKPTVLFLKVGGFFFFFGGGLPVKSLAVKDYLFRLYGHEARI